MNRTGTARAVTGILALAVLALGAGIGCRTEEGNPAGNAEPTRSPNEGIRGISLSSYRVGDTRWVLKADTASVFRERKRVEAERVQVDFFEEDEHVSTLTSDTGILLQATDDLEARGNVLVIADDGARLETEVLFWNHHRSRIHTDAYVKLTRGENVLSGIGMEADPGLDRVDLRAEVRGTLHEAPDEALTDDAPAGTGP